MAFKSFRIRCNIYMMLLLCYPISNPLYELNLGHDLTLVNPSSMHVLTFPILQKPPLLDPILPKLVMLSLNDRL